MKHGRFSWLGSVRQTSVVSTEAACRSVADELVGQSIVGVRYTGLRYETPDIEWDFGEWHYPEVGIELETSTGSLYYATWGSQVVHFELTLASGSLSDVWLPSQRGEARTWDVSNHPLWVPMLSTPIQVVELISGRPDGTDVAAPIAARIEMTAGELWIVAGGPKHPRVEGLLSTKTAWVGFDELMVVFERSAASRLGLVE